MANIPQTPDEIDISEEALPSIPPRPEPAAPRTREMPEAGEGATQIENHQRVPVPLPFTQTGSFVAPKRDERIVEIIMPDGFSDGQPKQRLFVMKRVKLCDLQEQEFWRVLLHRDNETTFVPPGDIDQRLLNKDLIATMVDTTMCVWMIVGGKKYCVPIYALRNWHFTLEAYEPRWTMQQREDREKHLTKGQYAGGSFGNDPDVGTRVYLPPPFEMFIVVTHHRHHLVDHRSGVDTNVDYATTLPNFVLLGMAGNAHMIVRRHDPERVKKDPRLLNSPTNPEKVFVSFADKTYMLPREVYDNGMAHLIYDLDEKLQNPAKLMQEFQKYRAKPSDK